MSDSGPVLVGFDGSAAAREAVGWAAREAVNRKVPLVLTHAFNWQPPVAAAGWPPGVAGAWVPTEPLGEEPVRRAAEQQLAEAADQTGKRWPDLDVTTTIQDGPAAPALSEQAARAGAALLVVGASGHSGLSRLLLGSTAAELVHTERRPVVVVRGGDPEEPAQAVAAPVVVGVDGSPTSYRAIGFAFDYAARHGCPLHAVHAWSDTPLTSLVGTGAAEPLGELDGANVGRIADAHLGEWRRRYPDVPLHFDVVADRPARTLLDRAEDARLLVVGSHGRGAFRRALLGSVSHAAVHHANCPVAVLRGSERDDET
ncbi:Nucleotide-binding universal stress protein, UspA family [Amycolatopsis arida]|uniref:Nucleotide-binding universal stress protein, UspA family n=1 Tax=Amycolatopsis arida TaxID=587909 RepID=A0A1I5LQA2_9PSEU|nr:universal stress protein [Amycolatopsis arida]TDX93800.1 nucleotide-binding universal stress UspA family protein [Amycolatopsis arida]SFO99415.1 Nucleotide-binding universal stress protein, UspA family [Amycolatopsis arida]